MRETNDSNPNKSWSRRKRARPGEILEAALAIFAEKGFAATRMEDIAQRAGVTKGTIYLYFPGKDELFKSLARETVGRALADVSKILADNPAPPRRMLIRVLETINNFLQNEERAALPKIIIAESGNFPELAAFWQQEVIGKALGILQMVYDKGVKTGEFRPLPCPNLLRLLVAPLIVDVIWRTTFHSPDALTDNQSLLSTHIDLLLNGLLTPEAAHAPH